MDPGEYRKILHEISEFGDIDTSTVSSTRRSIVKLNEKREELLRIKKSIKRDIRGVERQYLESMAEVMDEVNSMRDSSKLRRLLSGSPAAAQARAIRQIRNNRDALIESYREILDYTDELLEYTEDLMVELYESIRSFLG